MVTRVVFVRWLVSSEAGVGWPISSEMYVFTGCNTVVWGGMGPGAPGFARADSISDTGKPSLARAARRMVYDPEIRAG